VPFFGASGLCSVEAAGQPEAEFIAKSLGWENYHAVMSDFDKVRDSAYTGLEMVVISKKAIESGVEFDTDRDGTHESFGAGELVNRLPQVVEKVIENTALPTLGSFTVRDRGTLRIDLKNGLTIFAVHLKSNQNPPCSSTASSITPHTISALSDSAWRVFLTQSGRGAVSASVVSRIPPGWSALLARSIAIRRAVPAWDTLG
jgi:hypothetical protein